MAGDVTASGWAAELLDVVSRHRSWAPLVVALLSSAESIAFLSFVVPSTVFLVGVGALVAAGSLDFAPVWAAATAGALAGTTLSWWVGWRYGPSVLSLGPLAARAGPIGRAQAWFARWGVLAVFLGHVFAPVTSVVFLLAGVARIPLWRFQLANVPGAMIWAWFLPKSGELGGHLAAWLWTLVAGG